MEEEKLYIETEVLVSAARMIAYLKGEEPKYSSHCGVPIPNGIEYTGKTFRVLASKNTLKLGLDRLENDNPTTCVNDEGKIYRRHGEECYIAKEIMTTLKELIDGSLLEKT